MSKKNSKRGFSLIEVLVAMAIMGIILFAFLILSILIIKQILKMTQI